MGKLITKLGLPKKILLQGWAGDQGNDDINGEYTFIGNHSSVPSRQNIYINESISTPGEGVDDHPAIYWNGSYWEHDSDDTGWENHSTNPNELPLTGWVEWEAQGPAGTITPILTNTKNISIKKQNLGGGRNLLI